MSLIEELKNVSVTIRLPKSLSDSIKELNIDLAETCRQALQKEVEKLREENNVRKTSRTNYK